MHASNGCGPLTGSSLRVVVSHCGTGRVVIKRAVFGSVSAFCGNGIVKMGISGGRGQRGGHKHTVLVRGGRCFIINSGNVRERLRWERCAGSCQ